MQRGFRITGWILLALLAGSSSAHADSDYDTARKLRESGDILPLETILHKLDETHPGKVLEVELEKEHGLVIYEIELLDTDGKVWILKVDPRTGDILRQKQEH
ncbi:MAG: hypothetical protein GC149_02765 [Gammaproteobacteria bacterium]|nr:hypothetical protein [Gammaproteobacteria bacterium]